MKLYYSGVNKGYFSDEEHNCVNCHENIESYMLVVAFWNKECSWISTFCRHCFSKFKDHSTVSEKKLVILSELPEDAMPIIIRPPCLSSGRNISVFEAARLESERTTDNTVKAGRESWEGARIGNWRPDRREIDMDNVKGYLEAQKKDETTNSIAHN